MYWFLCNYIFYVRVYILLYLQTAEQSCWEEGGSPVETTCHVIFYAKTHQMKSDRDNFPTFLRTFQWNAQSFVDGVRPLATARRSKLQLTANISVIVQDGAQLTMTAVT